MGGIHVRVQQHRREPSGVSPVCDRILNGRHSCTGVHQTVHRREPSKRRSMVAVMRVCNTRATVLQTVPQLLLRGRDTVCDSSSHSFSDGVHLCVHSDRSRDRSIDQWRDRDRDRDTIPSHLHSLSLPHTHRLFPSLTLHLPLSLFLTVTTVREDSDVDAIVSTVSLSLSLSLSLSHSTWLSL
jgi:hypothetical protein